MKEFLSSIVTILVLLIGFSLFGSDKDYIQWWALNHGDYANTKGKNDPRVKLAFRVFEKVKNVADKVAYRLPRLFIVNTRGEPYALVLPDGGIIINPSTLDICYANIKPERGDQRMAFILGHELAHLGNDDFMHIESFLAMRRYGRDKANKEIVKYFNISDLERAKEYRLKELMADKKGVLYAAMAGYDVGGLFREGNNFLSLWKQQTGIKNFYEADSIYPSFKARLNFIRSQLLTVIDKVELFKSGVLLYHKGSYLDASGIFSEFMKTYPAREVFNNIGACHFNIALLYLHQNYPEVYYKFRVSTSINYTTNAEALTLKSVSNHLRDEIFIQYIKKAIRFFKLSLQKDSGNKTSRLNLSAALILKGEYAQAQGECDYILEKDPKDVKALNNKAIAFYYYGKKEDLDTTQKAIQFLERAHNVDPENFEVLYNLATLKTERKRMAGAGLNWAKYLSLAPRDNFYYRICNSLKRTCSPYERKNSRQLELKKYVDIRLGNKFLDVKKKLKEAKIYEYKLGSEKSNGEQDQEGFSLVDLHVMVKDNLRILFLGKMVEVIEMELQLEKGIQEMITKYGQPEKVVRHTCGNFYIYRGKGFSFKEVDGIVQSYIWYGKDF